MTYDQRTKDLAHAIFCLDEAGRILVSARLAVRWLGFEEDEQTLWEMTMKLDEVCRKVNDTLGGLCHGRTGEERGGRGCSVICS